MTEEDVRRIVREEIAASRGRRVQETPYPAGDSKRVDATPVAKGS